MNDNDYINKLEDLLEQKDIDTNETTETCINLYNTFCRCFPSSFNKRCTFIKKFIMYLIKQDDYNMAYRYGFEYFYNLVAQIKNETVDYNLPFFSFRQFSEYSLDDVRYETLSLTRPREFNDPMDTLFKIWLDDINKSIIEDGREQNEFLYIMRKAAEHIRIRCFIQGKTLNETSEIQNLSTLMWSHYANSHKGFCIEYKFNKTLFENLISNSERICTMNKVKYIDTVDIYNKFTLKDALFTKSIDWAYENETRLILYSKDHLDFYPIIECKKSIKSIFLGLQCSEENKQKMKDAIGDKNIKLYHMQRSHINPFKLEPLRIL